MSRSIFTLYLIFIKTWIYKNSHPKISSNKKWPVSVEYLMPLEKMFHRRGKVPALGAPHRAPRRGESPQWNTRHHPARSHRTPWTELWKFTWTFSYIPKPSSWLNSIVEISILFCIRLMCWWSMWRWDHLDSENRQLMTCRQVDTRSRWKILNIEWIVSLCRGQIHDRHYVSIWIFIHLVFAEWRWMRGDSPVVKRSDRGAIKFID